MRSPLLHRHRPRPRRGGDTPFALLTAVPLVAAALVGALAHGPSAAPASTAGQMAPAATAIPATSSTHPYSMPTWFPIHDETYLDCVLSNPGCGTTHTHWTQDMVLETLPSGRAVPRSPGVFAMGAGILHIQVAHGRACRVGGTADFGTTAWIDHGGGVVSRYGHLARILYADGTRLAAGQAFAFMGTTGKNDNCSVPYLDFQVRTRGLSGPTKAVDTLRVCSSPTTAATWPTDLDATRHVRPAALYARSVRRTFTSFNQVPKRTVDFPATTSACIPSATPATPNAPTGVHLRPAGRGRLTVSWTKAPSTPRTTSVQVQLSEYHTSTHTWDYSQNEEYRSVAATGSHYTYTGLVSGHSYRATVVLRNGTGYGRSVRTAAVKSVGAPSTPGARSAFVTHTRKAASLHFGWTRPKEYGLRVSGFQVQVRRLYAHSASVWATSRLPRANISWYRPGVHRHALYQVRVRAVYYGGATAFLTRTLRT